MDECFSSISSSSESPSESSPPAPAMATDESDTSHSSLLLPNLPDDVALQCIARVPRFYHSDLSLVSKSWRSMLRSPLFFSTRARLNCTQHLLYLNVHIFGYSSMWFAVEHSPSNPKNLSPVAHIPFGSNFAVLGSKIYVLGGYVNSVPSSTVWIFDCRFNRWEIGPRMRVERVHAKAGVLNGKIYVMGGRSVNSSVRSTDWAEVLDPALGSWVPIPSPVEVDSWESMRASAVVEDKFYAVENSKGVVFDPCDLSWHDAPTGLDVFWTRGDCVVDGILYSCEYLGRRIRGFDLKEGIWKELKGLEKDLSESFHGATLVNVGGRLCPIWEKYSGEQKEISCAEVEIRKDSNGGLWGSVVWSHVILVIPRRSVLMNCLVVEL